MVKVRMKKSREMQYLPAFVFHSVFKLFRVLIFCSESLDNLVDSVDDFDEVFFAASFVLLPQTALATGKAGGDPLVVVNNLSDFIFALIRAIGIILLGLGIMQVGLSLKSHDPSQRANGFLTLAGGIVITFTKEILNLIIG